MLGVRKAEKRDVEGWEYKKGDFNEREKKKLWP